MFPLSGHVEWYPSLFSKGEIKVDLKGQSQAIDQIPSSHGWGLGAREVKMVASVRIVSSFKTQTFILSRIREAFFSGSLQAAEG